MKRFLGTLAVLFWLVVVVPPAVAHQGDPNYRSEITSITPAAAADGLSLEIKNFDADVELVNRTGKAVEVKGYDGEPYLRVGPDGLVEVNLNSPAYYLNQDRYADVAVPDRADPDADPGWKEIDSTGTFLWHDHRSHYMGLGTPPQVKDDSVETKVFDYSIPATVGGKPVEVNGTLAWVGDQSGFSFVPFAILAVLIAAVLIAARIIRRRRNGEGDDDGDEGGPGEGEEQAEAW